MKKGDPGYEEQREKDRIRLKKWRYKNSESENRKRREREQFQRDLIEKRKEKRRNLEVEFKEHCFKNYPELKGWYEKERRKIINSNRIDELGKSYIVQRLVSLGFDKSEITDDLIESKRLIVTTERLINNKQ